VVRCILQPCHPSSTILLREVSPGLASPHSSSRANPSDQEISDRLAASPRQLRLACLHISTLLSNNALLKDILTRHSHHPQSMSFKENQQDQLLASCATSDSLSSTSILNWIQKLRTPPNSSTPASSSTPPLLEESPTRTSKRSRSLDSTPSVFLGDGPLFQKRRQEVTRNMVDEHASRLPTPNLDGIVSSTSKTPTKSNDTSITNPKTPSPKRPNPNTDHCALGYKMSLYGLMLDDDAFEKAPAFKSHIEDIITSERGSRMKDRSVMRFRESMRMHRWANKVTFLNQVIPILQGYGYHVTGKPVFTPEQEDHHQHEGSEWRDFISDEMVKVDLDSDFKRTLLPSSFAQDPLLVDEIASDLAKDEDMTNPRPDMTFGLDRDKHPLATETHIPQHILDLLEIVPAIHHVFLIIEGISQSGSSATAENQARRGGATLVKASRTLRAIVERGILTVPVEEVQELAGGDGIQRSISKPAQKHPIRPDYNSFVFSVTICPNVFGIWVHWFDEGNQLYQMNHVDSLAINNSKGPAQVRMALHNIIEFGVWNRREQNEQLVRMIEEYSRAYRENEMQAAEDDVQAAKSAAESGKSTARSTGSPSKKRSAPEESPSSASRS